MMGLRKCVILLLLLPIPARVSAQQDKGHVSGGLESQSIYDVDGAFRSNNYFKLDYIHGRFSAGIQAEYYPEPLLGYDVNLKGFGVPGKYVAWTDRTWGIALGDFHEQFGTGIILRSWEDRALGWNNSIGGGLVNIDTESFSLKVLGGVPRRYLGYSPSDRLAGAEAAFNLLGVDVQGSMVLRHDGAAQDLSWSVLSGYSGNDLSVRAEWVGRPGGNAQTVEMTYAKRGFSSSLTVRRLDNMLDPMGMNYLPSLTQEQSYMLASLNPYTTFASGELGGSADVFYRYKTWRFHANGAYILALPKALRNNDVLRLAYRDINLQAENRWNRHLKTVFFVSIQENSPTHGDRKATDAQNVFVLDGVYRFRNPLSLRMQAQYLYSEELTRDWMAALVELSSTKGWGVHLQDMYNHGSTGEHYYEAGVSWSHSGFKADLSYGHQRSGLVCSGGVCRWQPEYEGGMLRLLYNF